MSNKIRVIVYGIKLKMQRGEELETILDSYKKLTDEEKETIRIIFNN